jgi:hypothetical protein
VRVIILAAAAVVLLQSHSKMEALEEVDMVVRTPPPLSLLRLGQSTLAAVVVAVLTPRAPARLVARVWL